MSTTIEDQVRAWARGMYAHEAAVELLIRSGKAIYTGAPWLMVGDAFAAVDVDLLSAEAGVWSSGERALVDIAVSLLGGVPVDLGDAIGSLDRRHLDEVLAALAHAGGSHQHSEVARGDNGGPAGFVTLPTLHPWPA